MAIHRDEIPLRSPCDRTWESLTGSGEVRHCEQCGMDVVDLTASTEAEIRARLAAAAGERLCVRYRVRADGTVITRVEEPRRARPGVTAALVATALAACTGSPPRPDTMADRHPPVAPAPAAASAAPMAPSPCSARPGDEPDGADDGETLELLGAL